MPNSIKFNVAHGFNRGRDKCQGIINKKVKIRNKEVEDIQDFAIPILTTFILGHGFNRGI